MLQPDRHAELRRYAPRLQSLLAERGYTYSLAQIETALDSWLSAAVSDLIIECAYHCIEGNPMQAVARYAFDQALRDSNNAA